MSLYMTVSKSRYRGFEDDGMSYQERMRRQAAREQLPQRIGLAAMAGIRTAIKWTMLTTLWAIVGGVFFMIGLALHQGSVPTL